jgi:hypothetical protein
LGSVGVAGRDAGDDVAATAVTDATKAQALFLTWLHLEDEFDGSTQKEDRWALDSLESGANIFYRFYEWLTQAITSRTAKRK